jgi:hypothetical protein
MHAILCMRSELIEEEWQWNTLHRHIGGSSATGRDGVLESRPSFATHESERGAARLKLHTGSQIT